MGYANGFDSGYDAAIADVKAGRVPGLGMVSEGGSSDGESAPAPAAPSPRVFVAVGDGVGSFTGTSDPDWWQPLTTTESLDESDGFPQSIIQVSMPEGGLTAGDIFLVSFDITGETLKSISVGTVQLYPGEGAGKLVSIYANGAFASFPVSEGWH